MQIPAILRWRNQGSGETESKGKKNSSPIPPVTGSPLLASYRASNEIRFPYANKSKAGS